VSRGGLRQRLARHRPFRVHVYASTAQQVAPRPRSGRGRPRQELRAQQLAELIYLIERAMPALTREDLLRELSNSGIPLAESRYHSLKRQHPHLDLGHADVIAISFPDDTKISLAAAWLLLAGKGEHPLEWRIRELIQDLTATPDITACDDLAVQTGADGFQFHTLLERALANGLIKKGTERQGFRYREHAELTPTVITPGELPGSPAWGPAWDFIYEYLWVRLESPDPYVALGREVLVRRGGARPTPPRNSDTKTPPPNNHGR